MYQGHQFTYIASFPSDTFRMVLLGHHTLMGKGLTGSVL